MAVDSALQRTGLRWIHAHGASRLPWQAGLQPVVSLADRQGTLSALTGRKPVLRCATVTLNLKRKMEPLKSRKGTKNQGLAVNDILPSRVSESISPTLLFLVIFGAFRGFHFGIWVETPASAADFNRFDRKFAELRLWACNLPPMP